MKKDFKVLVLVEDYPSNKSKYPMAYVHSRNVLYKKYFSNIKIHVLSFRADENYEWDGISVYQESFFSNHNIAKDYDVILSHAPNLKNHARFIISNRIDKVVFFIHGHEVLNVADYYPDPYPWVKKEKLFFRKIYDFFKLRFMGWFFSRGTNFKFIFVSQWMKNEALKNLNCNDCLNSTVIHNPINSIFIENKYNPELEKNYDFVTVRPLDGSKYCVDIVYKIARNNPGLRFRIVGKGDFFKHNEVLDNIFWEDKFYSPSELVGVLNSAKAALMPTRLDAQGVMMCEMAAFGIPLITSDLPICLEMLSEFKGVYFISNENYLKDFQEIINKESFATGGGSSNRFLEEHIITSEVNFFTNE